MASLAPLPTDSVSLTLMVEALSAQVTRLEQKLADLHGTDVNVLRRAHGSMVQHVDALAEEADGLLARVRSLECGGIVNARSVAEDMGTVAAGGAFGYVFHRIIAKEPAAPFWLRIAPWLIGGGCALFNIVRTSERRWEAQTERNAARKALLLQQAARVEERIAIMLALSKPTPALPLPEHVAVTVPNA